MTNTNVKSYTDKQLLDYVRTLPSFRGFPKGYWILGIRSSEDASDVHDDKFYLFKERQFVMVTSGTTNPGKYGLLNYKDYNSQGCAIVKADEWYYDVWGSGLHKGKMKALVQIKPILYYRDNNNNLKSEQIGNLFKGIIGINFHTITYEKNRTLIKKIVAWLIGKWSLGCQVCNVADDYYTIIDLVYPQQTVTYCLINEI